LSTILIIAIICRWMSAEGNSAASFVRGRPLVISSCCLVQEKLLGSPCTEAGAFQSVGLDDRGSIPGRSRFLLSLAIAQWYSAGLRTGWSRFRVPAGAGNFSLHHRVQSGSGPTQPSIQWVQGTVSLEVKRPGCEADHSPQSSAEVKEWVELYIHSTNTPSWRGAQLKATATRPALGLRMRWAIPPLPHTSPWSRT
jgi:hypothetical protein